MKLLRLSKPSPAMVVACLSLFIALGGTSFAAVALTRNSVGSKHIRNGQVKRVDLGGNTVNSAKVLDASLLAKDFAAGQLPTTIAFASTDSNPSDFPELTIATQAVTLPAAGRLVILGRMTRTTNCSAGTLSTASMSTAPLSLDQASANPTQLPSSKSRSTG